MPVKYYVSKDSQGRERGPDWSHEVRAAIDIIEKIYEKFNHLPEPYAVIANLNKLSIDLLIITERGLGVVELKHHSGIIEQRIEQRIEEWYAGPKLISAGKNARNPHEQVQNYASTIRDLLLRRGEIKKEYKINTAVCFTNPRVELASFRQAYNKKPMTWEAFEILTPEEMPKWVMALRFGPNHPNEPYRLKAPQVEQLVTNTFKAIPWTEIESLVCGVAYAYLHIKKEGTPTSFSLTSFPLKRDIERIGRDEKFNVKVPYSFVSIVHAQIKYTLGSVTIEDLGSSYGTFVNGKRITQATSLQEGDLITLGGEDAGEEVCILEFSFKPAPSDKTKPPRFTKRARETS